MDTHDVIDILENRTTRLICVPIFERFDLKNRQQVKTVTIDNEPYVRLFRDLFPNAAIIFQIPYFNILGNLISIVYKL